MALRGLPSGSPNGSPSALPGLEVAGTCSPPFWAATPAEDPIENWSLTLDMYILLKTVGAVLRREGAY